MILKYARQRSILHTKKKQSCRRIDSFSINILTANQIITVFDERTRVQSAARALIFVNFPDSLPSSLQNNDVVESLRASAAYGLMLTMYEDFNVSLHILLELFFFNRYSEDEF